MARTVLVTGGTRSGKSRLAEKLASAHGEPLLYLATGQPGDPEMAERIARHRERRGTAWRTFEEPLAPAATLLQMDGKYAATLVDCMTLWISNLLCSGTPPNDILEKVKELTGLLRVLHAPVVLVTNEVGMGIVPDNLLARQFRDVAGSVNQLLAAAADEVYVTISGLPLKLK
jgi:adenosylcobinamide kinase/adenosylcobinamide-phosphate guanylyltransferase